MKYIIALFLLLLTSIMVGQDLSPDNLWRTTGVHDSLGNFIKRAKIQSFLYIASGKQIQRLHNQDKINMETGETRVFVYKDTFDLDSVEGSSFRIGDKETLTVHSTDSLTIQYNGYNISYVRLSFPKKKVNIKQLKKVLLNTITKEVVEGTAEYNLTYQDNELVKISPLDSPSEWESNYQLIDFNGFILLQGIVSAPKLVVQMSKKEIQFIEIDYRFENKNGVLILNP